MLTILSRLFPSDIPNQYQKGFHQFLLTQNLRNTILLSWLMLGIHLLFFLTDFFHYFNGNWKQDPTYKVLFYFHLAAYPIYISVLLIAKIFKKQIQTLSSNLQHKLVIAFIFTSAFWFVGVAVYDQLLHEKITLYLLFIFVPGLAFTLNQKWAFISQAFAYTLLVIGLFSLQPNTSKIIGHLINGLGFAIIGNLVAFYYYRSRGQAYVSRILLKERTKELKEVNGELKRFVYAVSHDLKAPLRMVSSFTNLLERSLNGNLGEESKEYMDYISNGTKRMNLLLDDLRNYAMVNREQLKSQEVNLNEVIAQVQQNLHVNIEESDADIEATELPTVKAASTHMLQLFQNLISNAIKFRRNVPPKITIQSKDNKDNYLISISDNGIGIEKEYLEQVFTLFKRLHTDNEYEGTGIGLAICQKIITNYGGEIWLNSEPQKGTTFYFTVPKLS